MITPTIFHNELTVVVENVCWNLDNFSSCGKFDSTPFSNGYCATTFNTINSATVKERNIPKNLDVSFGTPICVIIQLFDVLVD